MGRRCEFPCCLTEKGHRNFGGHTFEIFWKDGYAALESLDDDRDGFLRGHELEGLRAWFDNNSNGYSEPDEMRDLDELGIEAIAVRGVSRVGLHPTNPVGLEFKSGRKLPTWDWMVEPAHQEL